MAILPKVAKSFRGLAAWQSAASEKLAETTRSCQSWAYAVLRPDAIALDKQSRTRADARASGRSAVCKRLGKHPGDEAMQSPERPRNDIEQFRAGSKQVILWPAEYKAGNMIYP
jgi:hypothetical protein